MLTNEATFEILTFSKIKLNEQDRILLTRWQDIVLIIRVLMRAGLYFSSLICMNVLGIIMTVVSVNLHHRSSAVYKMPPWVSLCV